MGTRIPILSTVSDEDFKEIVSNSYKWCEVAEKVGYSLVKCNEGKTGFYQCGGHICRKRAISMNLNIDHMWKRSGPNKPIEDLKPNNYGQKRRGTAFLINRLCEANVLEICACCRCEHMKLDDGTWLWNGKPMTLQVDHVHGRSKPPREEDDKVSNLRYLCWNCHTQTPGNKLRYKVNPPKTRSKHIGILIKSGREYVCEICKCEHMEKGFNGAWEWQGWMLNLQCDHIDGDRSNNDISNLRWLCPNCHATTDTYCGRNRKRKRSQKSTSNAKSRLS